MTRDRFRLSLPKYRRLTTGVDAFQDHLQRSIRPTRRAKASISNVQLLRAGGMQPCRNKTISIDEKAKRHPAGGLKVSVSYHPFPSSWVQNSKTENTVAYAPVASFFEKIKSAKPVFPKSAQPCVRTVNEEEPSLFV